MSIRTHIAAPKGKLLLEFDYSQLEVNTLACLSGDKALLDDINRGIDMHCMSASLMSGFTYDRVHAAYAGGDPAMIALRKQAKAVSFLVQYGGGAASAAATAGVDITEAARYIQNYKLRHPDVENYHAKVLNDVQSTRTPVSKLTPKGVPVSIGYYIGPTGRVFCFAEQDSPKWLADKGKATSFAPTQIKNYPTQGTAFDIVNAALVRAELMCYHKYPEPPRFINQVHDSLMYEVNEEEVSDVVSFLQPILEDVAAAVETYGWDIPKCNFRVEAKVGENWNDMVIV